MHTTEMDSFTVPQAPERRASGGPAAWLAPFTGVAFVIVGIAGFIVQGSTTSADKPASQVVKYYVDKKTEIEVTGIIGIAAGVLLIVFGAHLRKVLRDRAGEDEILSLVAFAGLLAVAVGFAIDSTIQFALADRVKDISPAAVQALQALYDDDFLPLVLGVAAFLWGTGLSVIRSGALPKWMGWLMVLLGVLTFTPIGFVSAIGSALLVLVISIMLTLRARAA